MDWQALWQKNHIPFHRAEVHPLLLNHWQRLQLPPNARVLVPLAGKSLDIAWLAKHFATVIGVELSAIAVEAFFNEQSLAVTRSTHKDYVKYQAGNIQLLCGDIFTIPLKAYGEIDAIYDRTALIALDKATRQSYTRHLCQLKVKKQLLITLNYDQALMQGPPFAVSDSEVNDLYADHYQIETITKNTITPAPDSDFYQRGLAELTQAAYYLKQVKVSTKAP